MGSGERRVSQPWSGPYLGDDAQDTADPLGGMEAAWVGAHGVQDAAHELQVVDGLGPYGAAKLPEELGKRGTLGIPTAPPQNQSQV